MKLRLCTFAIAGIIGLQLFGAAVFAQEEDEDETVWMEEEYRQRVRELNERYEDFYVQQRESEVLDRQRRQALSEFKKQRQEEDRAYEETRLEQIRERKAEPDTTPLEQAHERKEKELEKLNDRYRRKFIEHRSSLKKIETSARHIPPKLEYSLDDPREHQDHSYKPEDN